MNHAHLHALLQGGLTELPPTGRVRRSPATGDPAPWLSVAEFGYDRIDDAGAILRLMAALDSDREVPSGVTLLIERRRRLTNRLDSVRWIRPSGSEWCEQGPIGCVLWQVSFDLPLEVVRSPRSLFTLTASNRLALALPAPRGAEDLLELAAGLPRRRVAVARVRRSAVAFTAGLAAAAAVGSAGGAALAGTVGTTSPGNGAAVTSTDTTATPTDTTVTTPPPSTTTTTATTPPPPTTTTTATTPPPPTPPPPTPPPPPPPDPTTTTTTATPPPTDAPTTATTPTPTTATTPAPTTPTTPAPPTTPAAATLTPTPTTTLASAPHAGPTSPTHATAPAKSSTSARARRHQKPSRRRTPAQRAGHRHPHSGGHRHRHDAGTGRQHGHDSTGAPAGPSLLAPVAGGVSYQDPFSPAQLSLLSSLVGSTDQPPAFLVPIYKAAGRRYHIPWRILAAINAIETDYGRNLNVSSAGAMGWMQFMPETWAGYGVDVTGHHRPNPYDPRDAIFAAARYLAAAGGQHDLRRAIFAYNHAVWYVDAVLWRAQTITGEAAKLDRRDSGYALPLDGLYMHELGRTDDGVDIETAPDGAAVYSITPGVVTAVASDPTGFGPDYPVVLVTSGPLAGQSIYYGHVAASLVKVGQQVIAGQPIAIMGHTGDALSLGHGHIEIGFSTSGGDPLNHHSGAGTAWTPSGAAMRSLLVALSRSLGIKNS